MEHHIPGPPNPPLVAIPLPQQPPQDPKLSLPQAPSFPPSTDDVLQAVRYRRAVDRSTREAPDEPLAPVCDSCDQYRAILFEHGVVAQATAAATPGAVPPWFHGAIETLRTELLDRCRAMARNEVQQELQEVRGQLQEVRGQLLHMHIEVQRDQEDMREVLPRLNRLANQCRNGIRSLFVVPFPDGQNPPVHLPRLTSVSAINRLNVNHLEEYLTGYGVPLPAGTNLRRDALKRVIGVAP